MTQIAPAQALSTATGVAATAIPPRRRAAALAGIAFALLLFFGVFFLNVPLHATDPELVDWWSNGSNQTTAAVSMYLFAAAALCFLVFLTQLSAVIRGATGGEQFGQLTFASGVVFATMLAVAGMARGVVGKAVAFNDQPLPGADTLRYLMQTASAALGVMAMLAIAVTIITVSIAIVRTSVVGRWLGWLGFIAALAILAVQAIFSGELAIPAVAIWTIAACTALWRAPNPATGAKR